MPAIDDAMSESSDGVVLSVEVTSGAKHDRFPDGFNPWRRTVGCRVAAPAIGGRANTAVVALLAEYAGLPQTALSIRSGMTSPVKKILLVGITKADLTARIQKDLDQSC